MNLSTIRTQIISRNQTASQKAEALLVARKVYEMSKDEWRELIVEIPEDVMKEIGTLMSAGTQLDLQARASASCLGFDVTLAA